MQGAAFSNALFESGNAVNTVNKSVRIVLTSTMLYVDCMYPLSKQTGEHLNNPLFV